MNNVWTAIAFRAPCAARQLPRKPLLQLFNGYARSISTHNQRSISGRAPSSLIHPSKTRGDSFTISAIVSAREKGRKAATKTSRSTPPSPNKYSPSKLRAARTAASHTEDRNAGSLDADGGSETTTLTWRDYDPAGGMPLPSGELGQTQINDIFGSEELETETGNYVLSVMYWRRQSGALIDDGLNFPKNTGVTREQALQGLEYMRSLDPQFDEEAAGQIWANEETMRLQETLRQRAVKIGLYKPDEPEYEEDAVTEESDQGTAYGRARNQDSQLLRLRQENIAREEREEAERKAKQEQDELAAFRKHRGPLELGGGVQPPTGIARYSPDGIVIRPPNSKAWLEPVERKPWVKRYEQDAEIITDGKVPDISLLRRLGPSFLLMLATLSLAYWVSESYTPPPKSARIFPDTPPAVATVAVLTAALVTGFVLTRLPPMWRTVNKYFTIVPAYPYAVSIVGAAFNHQPFMHLVTNSVSLVCFGLLLHEDVGRGTFLAIFFASGAVGGFSALTYNVLRKNFQTYIFGSSSCALGVAAAALLVRPERRIKVAGYEVPVAMWLLFGLYAGAQLVVAARGLMPGIDHAGHIGGLVVGSVSAWMLRRKTRQQEVGEQEVGVGTVEQDEASPAAV